MPTNVSIEYLVAEKKYNEAETLQQKINVLEKMLSLAPSHKGAEHLRKDIKERIKKLKELEQKNKKRRKGGYSIAVPKEGFQIVIIGFTNTGKSTVLKKLTHANPLIAGYPFTTKKPEVGMLDYEGAQIQLVEVPALKKGAAEEQAELMSIIHASDGIILIRSNDEEEDIIKKELNEFGINKPLFMINKFYEPTPKEIFDFFQLIKVYTKEPGEEVDKSKPLVLKKGATVLDAAKDVHKDFYKKLKFAKVWGSTKFEGQRVERNYKLKDKDIIELHL